MSLSDRIANIINQKVNKIVERHDDPPKARDYPAVKQTEMMQRLSSKMDTINRYLVRWYV
jgi:hypothetical protein